ncbi:Nn.00g071820.m01.CDS01 [Neocucurbitaria sp. VM-36]
MAPDKPSKTMKQKKSPTAVADFTILSLTLPALSGLPSHHGDTAKHYMYIKPHSPSIPTADDERSLFIANVPIDASEKNLRALFADQLGGAMVERVEFDASIPAERMHKRFKSDVARHAGTDAAEQRGKKRKRNFEREEKMVAEGVVEDEDSALPAVWNGELRKSGSGAVVVFVDKKSARGAMKEVIKAVKEGIKISWTSSGEGLGIERTYILLSSTTPKLRYKSHTLLTYPAPPLLQSSINAYLTQFTALESLRLRHRKTARSVPDEEGFVTVTRGGRVGPARIAEAEKKKAELEERKKNNGVKDDFYRFQNREKRKEREGELKRRFEEDRRRVGEMRERRGRVRPEV